MEPLNHAGQRRHGDLICSESSCKRGSRRVKSKLKVTVFLLRIVHLKSTQEVEVLCTKKNPKDLRRNKTKVREGHRRRVRIDENRREFLQNSRHQNCPHLQTKRVRGKTKTQQKSSFPSQIGDVGIKWASVNKYVFLQFTVQVSLRRYRQETL